MPLAEHTQTGHVLLASTILITITTLSCYDELGTCGTSLVFPESILGENIMEQGVTEAA